MTIRFIIKKNFDIDTLNHFNRLFFYLLLNYHSELCCRPNLSFSSINHLM